MSTFIDDPKFIAYMGHVAEDTGTYVRRKVTQRVDPLESRVAALELRLLQGLPRFELDADADGHPRLTMIDGSRTMIQIVPGLLDRKMWRDGTVYRKGDVTSRDGGLWLCQKDYATGKPGSSDDWRLALLVRGRD